MPGNIQPHYARMRSGTLLRKKLIVPGEWHAPQGKYVSSRQRSERQVAKFRELKNEGVLFEVPWGHRLSAYPRYGEISEEQWRENQESERARFNASYVEDLEVDPADGGLIISMKPPPGYRLDPKSGDLVNETDHTVIREVSGAFGNWIDGQNRFHDDILLHAALCVKPVVAGMPGFQLANGPVTLSGGGRVEYLYTLSTGGPAMDDELDEGKKKKKKGGEPDDKPLDAPELPPEDDIYEPEEPLPDEPKPAPATPVEETPAGSGIPKPKGNCVKKLLPLLVEAGLPMDEDVSSPEELCERLATILGFAVAHGMRFEREENEDVVPAPGATGTAGGPAPAPEQPPVMMSLGQIRDPLTKKMAEREQERMRRDVATVWRENAELGCPVWIANREMAKGQNIQLSLNANTGKIPLPKQLAAARLVREILQAQQGIIKPPAARTEVVAALATKEENPAAAAKAPHQRVAPGKKVDPEVRDALRAGATAATGVNFSANGTH